MYLFVKRDNDIEWVDETPSDNNGQYLLSVGIVSGSNEALVKYDIESSDREYRYVNVNLSPGNGYTYLTYSLTDNPDLAIKDIRVISGANIDNSGGPFMIGEAPYAGVGFGGGFGYLVSTSYLAGDPIFADSLVVTDDAWLADGYIPVCHVAGGPAVNLNEHERCLGEDDHCVRLYFKSDRAEDDNDDTVYLSGMAEFHVADYLRYNVEWDISDLAEGAVSLGYTVIPGTEKTEWEWEFFKSGVGGDLDQYSCYVYSTTTYYKRALQDIIYADEDVKHIPLINTRDASYINIPSPMTYVYSLGVYLRHRLVNLADYPYHVGVEQEDVREISDLIAPSCVYVRPAHTKENAIPASSFRVTNGKPVEGRDYDPSFETYMSYFAENHNPGTIANNHGVVFKGKLPTAYGKYISGISVGDVHEDRGSVGDARARLYNYGIDKYIGRFTMRDGNRPCGDDHYFCIGVQTTDNVRDAITDIKLVCGLGDEPPQELLLENGLSYTLACPDNICYLDDDTYLWYGAKVYVSRHPGAGSPIVDFDYFNNPPMDGREYVECLKYDGSYEAENGTTYHKTHDVLDSLDNPPEYFFVVKREAPNKYISELGIVEYFGGDIDDDDYEDIVGSGRTKYHTNVIEKDLNEDAGGRYMYLTYKRTTDKNNAITDIKVIAVDDSDDILSEYYTDNRGIKYRKIHDGSCPDLNHKAGGDYIYLFATKDPRAGGPITDVQILLSGDEYEELDPGYKWACNFKGQRVDLNQDAGGDWVYLEFKSEAVVKKNIVASFFSELTPASYVIIGVSAVAIAGAYILGMMRKPRIKKKEQET